MTTSRTTRALKPSLFAGTLALGLSLLVARAHADAVPSPPTDCPAGAQGNSCHGGTYCTPPTTCTSSADCTGGEECQATAICIGQMTCYGGIVPPDGGSSTFPQPSVEGLCPEGTCGGDGGATCTTMSICVAPGSSSSSGGATSMPGGCSCKAGGGAGGPIALSALVVAAAGASLRGRRRARPGAQRAARQRRS